METAAVAASGAGRRIMVAVDEGEESLHALNWQGATRCCSSTRAARARSTPPWTAQVLTLLTAVVQL
jgi:hypothetical protein